MKILLINAPREGEVAEFTAPNFLGNDFFHMPPLGLLAIAAEVNPLHDLKVFDPVTKNMSIQDVVRYVSDFKPDLLGISVVSRRLYPAITFLCQVKAVLPDMITVAGGPHINDFPMETMQLGSVDYAMTGFCEKSFPMLVETLSEDRSRRPGIENIPGLHYFADGAIQSNPIPSRPIILDDLPFPKRELLDFKDYFSMADQGQMTTILTSRGCPYKCTFCDVQEKDYYYRSTESIVDEFEDILSLGISEIVIFDDTFNMGRKRVIDMCKEILHRGLKVKWSARVRAHPMDREMLKIMKKAGCIRLHCGIESIHPKSLKNMKKKITLAHIKDFFSMCNEFNIDTLAYFILGFPEEDENYRKNFINEIKKLKPTFIEVCVLFPLAQTPMYRELLENGTFKKDYWYEFFKNPVKDWELPPFREPSLQEELQNIVVTSYKKFYLSPRFIMKDLQRNTTFDNFMRKIKLATGLVFADFK